jgi:hypothetical protein
MMAIPWSVTLGNDWIQEFVAGLPIRKIALDPEAATVVGCARSPNSLSRDRENSNSFAHRLS